MKVIAAIENANQEAGGSVLEMGEAEYMVRSRGYLKSLDDFRAIPLVGETGTPVTLGDVARIQMGPEMRRGIAELDGEGEVVGGVIVMRAGRNARTTIDAVKRKLDSLKAGLPAGVEIVPTYDRSQLIDRAVANLQQKLVEEFIVVALVCFAFLFPPALGPGRGRGASARGARGVRRDARAGITRTSCRWAGLRSRSGRWSMRRIVMIENAHRKLEQNAPLSPGRGPGERNIGA
jgi:Cu(I)/Ag(I) efflux system membrane protein CusA/SilA